MYTFLHTDSEPACVDLATTTLINNTGRLVFVYTRGGKTISVSAGQRLEASILLRNGPVTMTATADTGSPVLLNARTMYSICHNKYEQVVLTLC